MNDLSTALWITALGMGLVFGAIIVLWLMIVILTAASSKRGPAANSDSKLASASPLAPSPKGTDEVKAWAAAIAVSMALAEKEICAAHPLPEPPTAIVSAWQLGMRTRLLTQKGNVRRQK
jgi:hypothetical protein